MPNNDVQTTEQMEQQSDCISYAFRSMVMYEDGGGSNSNSNSNNNSNNNSNSTSNSNSNSNSNRNSGNGGGDSSSSGNGGSDIEDDCESWSEDGNSITGANDSSSSGSADEGCYSGDGEKLSTNRSGGSSSGGSSSGGSSSGGSNSGGSSSGGSSSGGSSSGGSSSGGSSRDGSGSDGCSGDNKRKWFISLRTVLNRVVGIEHKGHSKKRVVKSILRPPTTYKYVIGMSGLSTKVAVYPKTTMM